MEELSQNLIATLREPLLVLDYELRVRVANRAFYRIFQVEPAEVENQCLYELGDGQWDIPQLQAALSEVIAHDTFFEDLAIEHNFPHIGHKVMVLNARRVERKAGAAPLILLAIDDVTEQNQAAATMQQYLHKLEWSNRELENFAHIASHDLQEPLRAIQTFSDRLQTNYTQSLDAQGLDYLARIQRAAGRMRHLISDLLTYSRITTQAKSFERVQLTTLAQECSADLAKRLEETGGRIEVDDLPTIEADPRQMRQLLQNLFDNGLKFHRAEESPVVKIRNHRRPTAEFPAPRGSQSHEKFCYLTVEDNGIGFDEKYTDRIFLPFERLHNQSQYPGTGIGLAVCRRIVELHDGSLTVKSVPGQGTTFFVTLPLRQAMPQRSTELTL